MTSVLSTTDVGTMSFALYNMHQTQQTVDALTAEAASGYLSSNYAGLGSSAGMALDLTGELATNTTLQANTTSAATIQQVTQTALGQIQTLVSGVNAQLLGITNTSSGALTNVATSANDALDQIAGLLDTKVGDTYIFAGQDSSNPPVPNPSTLSSSAFVAAIQTAVAGLSTNGAAATQAQLLTAAAPGATSPFSATLEATNLPTTVDLGDGTSVQVGMLADQNTNAVSTGVGTTSTGSYMRDIFMGLSALGALSGANPGQAPVQSLLSGLQTTLSNADTALNVDIGGLGVRQDTVNNAGTELKSVATALTTQLGNAQDADQATVATELSTAQTQLQASYAIVSALHTLTLATYLV
jgi:flagellar hook-associated protein 3 FlgL